MSNPCEYEGKCKKDCSRYLDDCDGIDEDMEMIEMKYKESLTILEDYIEEYCPEMSLEYIYSEKWRSR